MFNDQYLKDASAKYRTPVRAARENDQDFINKFWDIFSLGLGFVTKPIAGVALWAAGKGLGSIEASNTGPALFYRRDGPLGNFGSSSPKDVNEWIKSGRSVYIAIPGPKKK
jgi:hypothetical protein